MLLTCKTCKRQYRAFPSWERKGRRYCSVECRKAETAERREADLTVERLRELLTYDESTGIFRWNEKRGPKAPTGSIAGFIKPKGNREIEIDGNTYQAHRLAYITADKRTYYLGAFASGAEAHTAYVEAAKRLHGEFARAA